MNNRTDKTSLIKCFFSVILALGLLFSFGLHSIQIEHEHFGAPHEQREHEHKHGFETLDTYMHLSDKKLFLSIPPAFLLSLLFLGKHMSIKQLILISASRRAKIISEQFGRQYRAFDYISHAFKRGLLHSKAY